MNAHPNPNLSERVKRSGKPPIAYLMQQGVANPQIISLAAGLVDHESLPVSAVRAAAAAVLATAARGRAALQYGTTDGDRALRAWLTEYLTRLDGASRAELGLQPDRVIIGTGSQQLLYLIGEVLIDPGDIVLLGVPGYFVYMGALESLGARLLPIATDEDGLIPDAVQDALERLSRAGELERVKFIYDVSYFNNPTGWTLSEPRRRQLVELARRWSHRQRIYVVEDAAYRELRYRGRDIPSMLRFDSEGDTVLYAGTFSKSFAPGLKTGYLVAPHQLVEPIIFQKGHHDFGSANFTQQLLSELLACGDYQKHLDELRGIYRSKLEALMETLSDELSALAGQVSWTKPEGGLYVWLGLPPQVSTSPSGAFFERCLAAGVLVVPGEYCYPRSYQDVPRCFARLSFGTVSADRVREGVRRLAGVLSDLLVPGQATEERTGCATTSLPDPLAAS